MEEIKTLKQKSAKEIQSIKANQQTVAQATEESPNSLLDNISKIKSHITQSLEDISNELIAEQQKLSTIQSAIKIQEQS